MAKVKDKELLEVQPDHTWQQWEVDAYNAGRELADTLGNQANIMGGNHPFMAGLLQGFVRQHRTLQQNIVRMFVIMMTEWGKGHPPMFTDARNEAAFAVAQQIGENPPYLPYI